MCEDSLASSALAGWMRSPSASSTRVTGSCASQSISRPGTSARSSRAIATSRCAWPKPIGEETYSARLGRATGPRPRRRRPRLDEVTQDQVHLHRIAGLWVVARALERGQLGAQELGQRRAGRVCADRVLGPVDHERSSADPRRQLHVLRASIERRGEDRRASVSGSVSRPHPTPSSICLVECGSVKIWPKKNPRKSS